MKPLSSINTIYIALVAVVILLAGSPLPVVADTASELEKDARHALDKLYARVPAAKSLSGSSLMWSKINFPTSAWMFSSLSKGSFFICGS